MITKEQEEIVEFTRSEFDKCPERLAMYEAIRFYATIKWPGEDFGPRFLTQEK